MNELENSLSYDRHSAVSAIDLSAATERSPAPNPPKPRRIVRRVAIAGGAVVLVLLTLFVLFAAFLPEFARFGHSPMVSGATSSGTIDLDSHTATDATATRYFWVHGTLAGNLTWTSTSRFFSYSEYFIPLVESGWTSRKPLRYLVVYVGRSLPGELKNKGSQPLSCRTRKVRVPQLEAALNEWRRKGLRIAPDYVVLDWIDPDDMPGDKP